MPNLDGTGPNGKGQKTGRKRGKCEGDENEGAECSGRGLGRRFLNRRQRDN